MSNIVLLSSVGSDLRVEEVRDACQLASRPPLSGEQLIEPHQQETIYSSFRRASAFLAVRSLA